MKLSLKKLCHRLFPNLCTKHLTALEWTGTSLYCPHCGKLLAYVFPLHGHYDLHIVYPYNTANEYVKRIQESLPTHFRGEVEPDEQISVNWELLREPIEPLISDTWDDDEAYEKCIRDYIEQNKQKEDESLNGKSE